MIIRRFEHGQFRSGLHVTTAMTAWPVAHLGVCIKCDTNQPGSWEGAVPMPENADATPGLNRPDLVRVLESARPRRCGPATGRRNAARPPARRPPPGRPAD